MTEDIRGPGEHSNKHPGHSHRSQVNPLKKLISTRFRDPRNLLDIRLLYTTLTPVVNSYSTVLGIVLVGTRPPTSLGVLVPQSSYYFEVGQIKVPADLTLLHIVLHLFHDDRGCSIP